MSSEESEEYFISTDGKILRYNSVIPSGSKSKKSCEVSLFDILHPARTAIEMFVCNTTLLGIKNFVHHIGTDQYWLNFAGRHIVPPMAAGLVFAVLETIFKYSLLYQQKKINDPELTLSDFLVLNLSDVKFYLLACCMVSSSAFSVLTSTAELAKTLHFPELSRDSLSVGLSIVVFATGNVGLNLPWEKIFFEITLGLSGFTAGRYLAEQKIMDKWTPVIISSSAALAASVIYNTTSYCCSFWSSKNKPQSFMPQKNIQDGSDNNEDAQSVDYKP